VRLSPLFFPWVREYFKAPILQDEEQTRFARLLAILLWVFLAAEVIGAGIAWASQSFTQAAALLLVALATFGLVRMLHYGNLQLVAILQLSILLLTINLLVYIGNGVHDIVMLTYPVLILLGSLLLSQKRFIFLVGLSLLSILVLGLGEIYGSFDNLYRPVTDFGDLLVIALILALTAVAVRLLTNDLHRSLSRARRNEERLAEANRKLEEQAEKIKLLNVTLEERVAQRTAELEAKNRELETFTYSASHDLKAPLRGIDGYAHLLLNEYAQVLGEQGCNYLGGIRQATQQMNQLINDLLTYAHLEQRVIRKEKVNLPELVQMVVQERQDEIERRKIDFSVLVGCHNVTADVDGLRQALRSLLDNALKFTPQQDGICIQLECVETEHGCLLRIRDNGIGFDMQYHDRIFEIFQRLNRAEQFPGTGIGLALVSKAMQRTGGRVWAESAPGAGATFYLEIPK